MAIIRTLGVAVKAKTGDFQKGIKRARKALKTFEAGMTDVIKKAARMSAALAAAAIAGAVVLTKKTLKAADVQIKFAKRLGISQEALAGFELANEKAGNEANVLRIGLQRMQRRLSEASVGAGEAQGAIKELGLDAKKLGNLPIDQQFLTIADALNSVRNEGDRTRLTFKFFDSEGVALINTMKGGSRALLSMRTEARRLGLVLSNDAVMGIEAANDAATEFGALLRGSTLQIVSQVAPAIEIAADAMKEALGFGDDLKVSTFDVLGAVKSVVIGMAKAFQQIEDVIRAIKIARLEVEEFLVSTRLQPARKISLKAPRESERGLPRGFRGPDPFVSSDIIAGGIRSRINKLRREEQLAITPEAAGRRAGASFEKGVKDRRREREAQDQMVNLLKSIDDKTAPAINVLRAVVGI